MSFGVALRNGVAIGLGSIASLFSGYGRDTNSGNLETESGANLVQEDLSLYSGLFSTVGQHANISVINTVGGNFVTASNLGV